MEAVLWYIDGKQAENCLDRLQILCHQMDSSGGLVKAVVGEDVGHGNFVLVTFWKAWDNVTRYLGNHKSDMLPKLGSPHHFEVVWQFPKEEVVAARAGGGLILLDVYAAASSAAAAETLLEHLRTGVGRLSHETGFASAAIWIERNNAEHMILAAHWSGTEVPDEGVLESCLRIEADGVELGDKRVTRYQVKALGPLSTLSFRA